MIRLLRVDASASDTSVSRCLADAFVEELHAASPKRVTVAARDLAKDPVNHMTRAYLGASVASRGILGCEEQAAMDQRHVLASEVASADVLVLSSPMYNWSVPSNLKAWIDQMLVPGVTLPADPSTRPLENRYAVAFLAYGGSGSLRGQDAPFDFCEPYLKGLLGTVLGYQARVIVARNSGLMNIHGDIPCESFLEALADAKKHGQTVARFCTETRSKYEASN